MGEDPEFAGATWFNDLRGALLRHMDALRRKLESKVIENLSRTCPDKLSLIVLYFAREAIDFAELVLQSSRADIRRVFGPTIRALLERAIQLDYVAKLTDEGQPRESTAARIREDAECSRIQWKRILAGVGLLDSDVTEEEKAYEAGHCLSGKRRRQAGDPGWQHLNFEELCAKVGAKSIYDVAYRHLSKLAHPSLLFMHDFIDVIDGEPRVRDAAAPLDNRMTMAAIAAGVMIAADATTRLMDLGPVAGGDEVERAFLSVQGSEGTVPPE